jgi:uncharacterized membrane protein YagU involved in acid resistance
VPAKEEEKKEKEMEKIVIVVKKAYQIIISIKKIILVSQKFYKIEVKGLMQSKKKEMLTFKLIMTVRNTVYPLLNAPFK